MSSPSENSGTKPKAAVVLRPCKGCGQELHISVASCPHCGATQRSARYKGKIAAVLLAFFFGGLGIHRFYLGQWWGIFYLLLFWTMIPGIIALVEFIVFLVRSQEKWDEIYNDGIPKGADEKGSAALVVFLVFFGLFIIAVIGILAAIAIPQYAEYTHRARVANAISQTLPAKQAVLEFYNQHKILPESNIMAGLDEPYMLDGNHQIRIVPEGFELSFGSPGIDINSKTIVFTPFSMADGSVAWDCTKGTLDNRFRPPDCRQ